MQYVELFAGAGGLSRGLEAAGFAPMAHCEIEPHAQAVLRYRWPTTPLYGDVTAVDGRAFKGAAIISGGSPCQDLSVAGKRSGLEGSRSNLFYEQVRIWRESEAPYLIWENVYGALSSNTAKDFGAVLSTIVGAAIPVPSDGWRSGGVAAGPDAVAAWRVLDLQHFGPPQRRVRVFIVAARTGGVDPAEVLALAEGVCGHPSPRQQSREGATTSVGVGAEGRVVPYTASRFAQYEEGIGQLRAAGGDLGGGSETMLAFGWDQELNAAEELMGTLKARVLGGGHENGVIAFHHTQTPISGDVAPSVGRTTNEMGVMALSLMPQNSGKDCTRSVTPIVARMVAFGEYATDGTASTIKQRDYKDATDLVYAKHGRPRRLTPLECERLMSWPDEWTRYGRKEDGTEYELSDTARYRLCGNGVGSVCVEWFAKRLATLEAGGPV